MMGGTGIQEPIGWGGFGGDSWVGNRVGWKNRFLINITLASRMDFFLTKLAYYWGILVGLLIPEMRRAWALLSSPIRKRFLLMFWSLLKYEDWALLTVILSRFSVARSFSRLRKASYSTNLSCNSSKVITIPYAHTVVEISLNSGQIPLSVWVMRYWFGMGAPRRPSPLAISWIVAR